MKVLLAGATGAIGVPLTRHLVRRGHEVLGLTRDLSQSAPLVANGATPVIADALDRDALLRAVDGLRADAVIHELTALRTPPRRHRGMALTDRLRSDGTTNLIAAADVLGATRFVAQSIILGYGYRDHGDDVLDEDTPFGRPAGDRSDPHLAAMVSDEEQAFAIPHGVALRYGLFYGGDGTAQREALRKRGIPVSNGGLLGWVHHDDAALATVAALEHGRAGHAYNIVDDRPASWQEVFTEMAAALGAPHPRHLPKWLFRLIAPYVATFAVDTSMRVSNRRAHDELAWSPRHPTYVEGVAEMARATTRASSEASSAA
jgi:nucleoside-diphosphate-sugar epimerase